MYHLKLLQMVVVRIKRDNILAAVTPAPQLFYVALSWRQRGMQIFEIYEINDFIKEQL